MVKFLVYAFYQELNLVIDYRERQHAKGVALFDKVDPMTISGVHRGEQRKIYDEIRKVVLPQHGITLLEINYTDFEYDFKRRIISNRKRDKEILKEKLNKYIETH